MTLTDKKSVSTWKTITALQNKLETYCAAIKFDISFVTTHN